VLFCKAEIENDRCTLGEDEVEAEGLKEESSFVKAISSSVGFLQQNIRQTI